MVDYMEQEKNLSQDILDNMADRAMVCLCVDASMSMIKNGRKTNVDKGIKQFIEDCRNDIYACDSVELGIITFGGDEAKIAQPFANVASVKFEGINPNGNTPLGSAVLKALGMIQERKEQFADYGVLTYKPWLIIMSDGASTDDVSVAAERTKQLLRERSIKVKCIDMSDEGEKSDLEKFTLDGEIDTIKGLQIQDFFSILSRSVTNLSTQTPGQDEYDPIVSIEKDER